MTVLGHVDHGKTSLLDHIRQTKVAEKETGGITQKIGAYQVEVKSEKGVSGKITFIDTPGHQAFSQMRSRGAQVADLVVLVVAADDGVMPQTLESVEHIKAAGVPFLVVLNKIDLPGASPERVKQQLVQNGVLLEGYGGDVVCVPVSAKTGQGLDDLLEMILLLAQLQEIKTDPEGPLEAVVIESKKGKAGLSGTVLVRNGTLRVGDQISLDGVFVKVRGLLDENGKRLQQADPGQPVEVLGFSSLPAIGAQLRKVAKIQPKLANSSPPTQSHIPESEEGKLNIILKADSAGSLEALMANFPSEVVALSSNIGDVNESDVFLAQVGKAKVFAFKVRVPANVVKLAENEKVEIKNYEIVYQFLEDLQDEILKMIVPKVEEVILGKAEIIAEFIIEGLRVAGCRVSEGKILKDARLRLVRKDKILGETTAASMKKRAKTIIEAKLKEEFGMVLEPQLDFKVGDMLISFQPKVNE